MKLLIFADSHGRTGTMLSVAKNLAPDIAQIMHLGDNLADAALLQQSFPGIPIHSVAGNCDFLSVNHPDALLEIAGVRIFLTHGHRFDVKGGLLRLSLAARERQADICLYGHTHIASITAADGVMLMNPGSISLPRGYERESYGILTLEENEPPHAAVVETYRGVCRIIHSI